MSNRTPPPLPNTLNSLRMTYMSLFNQILDNSININCICKTTSKCVEDSDNHKNLNQVFDRNDFMSDNEDATSNDVEMTDSNETRLQNLDFESQKPIINRMCDLSCFENMRYIHFVLKNCFHQVNDENLAEKISRFDNMWSNFKFLTKNPKSCDYYGTTIFHYAAADNNCELLKYSLQKYPDGVFCIDSKGMTPLMRAVQRNSYKCVEFLLNETKSDLNGSSQSTYTPLWFAVSNGYDSLAMLLLNYNASSSIVNKSVAPNSTSGFDMMHHEELTGVRESRDPESITSLYLFSPLRASIVYSRFDTMLTLLKFNANVYELFGASFNNPNLPKCLITKSNEDYVNALKFFFRQFGLASKEENEISTEINHESYLNNLNDFVANPNVYRRMFLEFVKYIIFKINSNMNLVDKLYDYLNRMNKNSVDYVMRMTRMFQEDFEIEIKWCDYVELIIDFMDSLNKFLSLDNANMMSFSFHLNTGSGLNLRTYNQNLLNFSLVLMEKFFKPKSLIELCRFNLRKKIFEQIQNENFKYKDNFSKENHLELILQGFAIPNQLKHFLLHKN